MTETWNLACGHNPGNSWRDEQQAQAAATRLERSQALPYFARLCSICRRWAVHVDWKNR